MYLYFFNNCYLTAINVLAYTRVKCNSKSKIKIATIIIKNLIEFNRVYYMSRVTMRIFNKRFIQEISNLSSVKDSIRRRINF